MLSPVAKLLTLTLVINSVASTLGSLHHIQDDILSLPRYKVVLTNEKISNSQVHAKEVELPFSLNNVIMTSSSGQPFSCSIPDVQIEQERLEREKEEQAKEETEQDITSTIERGVELLEPLESNCMRFYAPTAQYWAYEYCHNRYVRQYHVERTYDGKVEKETETQSFFLGKYPGYQGEKDKQTNEKALSSKTPNKLNDKKLYTTIEKTRDQRHLLVQQWKDGSICDKTEKPRTTEIQFYCDPHGHDHVSAFEELTTCHYRIMIATPRLCEELNLSHRYNAESHKIECRPIVSDKLIEQEKSDNLLQAQQESHGQATVEQVESTAADQANEVDLGTEKEEIQKLLDSVVSKEAREDDKLIGLISDLTDQITKLRAQMNTLPNEPKAQRAEISLFTLDENGNIIPGVDFNQLIAGNQKKQQPASQDQAKDQQSNKQAYHQNYIAQ